MIRRLLATALCLGIGVPLGTPQSAEAAPPVQTIDVPSARGPNASDLIAVADGQYLFADGSIYDSTGLVDVVDEVVGATLAEFTGDEVVLTRGVSGAFEVVLVDLADDTVTVADVPHGVRAAGVEGWVVESVFHGWDATSWPLPDMEGIVTQQVRGRLVFGAWNTLAVLDIATREVREPGPKGNSQQIGNDGLGWRAPAQDCYWSWDETDPTCVSRTWGSSGGRLGRNTTVSMTYAEYPLPSRITDHRVWVAGRWVPAPAPEGVRVTDCQVPSVDAVCVGSSANGRSVYIIEPDGTWTTAVALPGEPVEVLDIALTPDALYGADARGTSTTTAGAWRRSASNAFATEKRLDAAGDVDASAGRALIGLQWFDGEKPGPGRLPQFGLERTRMSGTHVLLRRDSKLFDVAGRNLIAGSSRIPVDIFGTARLYDGALEDVGGQDYGTIHVAKENHTLEAVWGPWVSSYVRNSGGGVHITNRITSTTSRVDTGLHGPVWGLGDGIAVTHQSAEGIVKVFDTTNATNNAFLVPKFSFEGTPRSIDRNRLAWTTPDGGIRISTFPFGGASDPMMLGLTGDPIGRSTSAPWTPAFDFSAPLAKGQIVVKNPKGAVVHTIDTPASTSGSLRISWNTLNKAGKAVPNGGYTWELVVKDPAGRQATRVNHVSRVTGVLTIGEPLVSVATVAPTWEVPCGETAAQLTIPEVFGISYVASITSAVRTVTATANPGFQLTGKTSWQFTTPTRQSCNGTAPAPTFVDKPGTGDDRVVIPRTTGDVTHYSLDGAVSPAGTYIVLPGDTVVVQAHFWNPAMKPAEWRHTFSMAGAPTAKPQDPYSETGEYLINGRKWRTTCEPYSITRRCRTEIWGTQTKEVKGRFVSTNGWVFNNLTYLASPRATWKGNPLATTKEWTAADGRRWRTECDTALTGRNGCRSFVESRVIEAKAKAGGGYTYSWQPRWVFNNMVRFN